jgi:hypothetical protein
MSPSPNEHEPTEPPGDPSDDSDRSRANLIALVFIVALFVGAYWLFTELQRHREIENCIASGRRDCIPLVPTDGGPS